MKDNLTTIQPKEALPQDLSLFNLCKCKAPAGNTEVELPIWLKAACKAGALSFLTVVTSTLSNSVNNDRKE